MSKAYNKATKPTSVNANLTKEEVMTCQIFVLRAFLLSKGDPTTGTKDQLRSRVLELLGHSLPMEILKWRVPKLREECLARGGSGSGNKKELIHRLIGLTQKERDIEDRLCNDDMDIDEPQTLPDTQETPGNPNKKRNITELRSTSDTEKDNEANKIVSPKIVQKETIDVEQTITPKTKENAEKGKDNNEKITIIDLDQEMDSTKNISPNEECEYIGTSKAEKGDDDSKSVATQQTENTHKIRMGLSLTMLPSPKAPDKELYSKAKEWFKKLKEEDNHFRVLPWKKVNTHLPPIDNIGAFPNTVGRFRDYFSRAQVKTVGGQSYMDIYVQYSIPMEELTSNVDWFFKEAGMRMFNKTIQAESITQMGWLLYSYSNLDTKALADAISNQIGTRVGLRYKYINTDKYEPDREQRRKWMAIHIEADSDDSKKATRGLKELYSMSSTTFPLGIRMRLVSEYRDVKGNTTNSKKHTRLRIRQANFAHMLHGCPNDDICQLDWKADNLKHKSLRELIMEIQSNNKDTPGTLYHGVGMDWKGRIVFSYLSNKSNEGSMIAEGIMPYLRHFHGNNVDQFFDPEAVISKNEWYWDEKEKCIINPLSKELDALEDGDKDYLFAEHTIPNDSTPELTDSPITPQELALSRMNLLINNKDEDSVSTLGGSPKLLAKTKDKHTHPMIKTTPGLTSTASVTSAITLETRLSEMETNLNEFKGSIKSTFQETIKELFAQIPNLKQPKQSPGGGIAGRKNV